MSQPGDGIMQVGAMVEVSQLHAEPQHDMDRDAKSVFLTTFPSFESHNDEELFQSCKDVAVVQHKQYFGSPKVDQVDHSSRPPSPPDSGTSSPTVSTGPCPARLTSTIPPPNYGTVELRKIFRSSFPQDRNVDFVKSLKIRSVLTLVDTPPPLGFQLWMYEQGIQQKLVDIATNKDGQVNTTMDSICEALLFVMNSANYPLYIHCNQGKHRTGCVVACFRKIQRVPLPEILEEYTVYAAKKARLGDIALITAFEPSMVYEYAKRQGYFDGPQPRVDRVDSTIMDIDELAAALASGAMPDGSALSSTSSSTISTVSPVSDTTGVVYQKNSL